MIAAIIPAKGNSTGIKQKNTKKLANKELVRYTIEAAKNSKYIRGVFVTTDSTPIIQIASEYSGVEILSRPPVLTTEDVQVDEVVLFAYRQIQRNYPPVDAVVVLQPTSPFRTSEHIDEAIELYQTLSDSRDYTKKDTKTLRDLLDNGIRNEKYFDTVVGMYCAGYAYEKWDNGTYYAHGHNPTERLGRQQSEYDDILIENGSIYVVDARKLSDTRSFRGHSVIPYEMDWLSSFELDEPAQWDAAEALVKYVYSS